MVSYTSRPIFIGGQMKSGTTMVRSLLGRHKNLYAGLETHWFNYNGREKSKNADFILKLQKLFDISDVLLADILEESKTSNSHFIDCFLGRLARDCGKFRWVEKTPENINKIEDIFRLWPTAYFLNIVRDFRDVFASWKLSGKDDLGLFLESVLESHGYVVSWGADPRFQSIHYEKLVANPESVMSSVLKWLGEPEQDECYELDTDKSREEFARVLKTTGKASQTLLSAQKKIFTDKVGSYENVLNRIEINTIERELLEPLSYHGYV